MSSIVDTLMKQVNTGNNLSTITNSVGHGNSGEVQSVLNMALPLLLHSMSNSASTPSGANALTNMMSQTGASNPLDNLGSYVGNPAAAGGSSMVNTLLGDQLGGIQNAISKKTGVPSDVVGKVLAIAAPLVVGHLSKVATAQKMDQKALVSHLGEQSKAALQSSPDAADMANQFLATGDKGGLLRKLFGS